MIWFLNSKLDLNLSCAKDFQNLISMVTWCINWRRLLALIIFQRSLLKYFPIIKRLAIILMYCSRLHAWWSTQSLLATLLSSLITRQWVGLQTLWWFRLKDLSIDEMVGAWCFGCLSGPPGFTCWISFAPVFSFIYCWVLIFALSLDLYVWGDDALISKESYMQTKNLCVLIHIWIKGEVGAVKPV